MVPRLSLVVVALALVGACGSKEAPPATGAAPGKHVDASTAGSVSGKVVYQGPAPPVEMVRMDVDPGCGASSVASDAVLVDASGEIQNVFVYVKDGLDPSYTFDQPTEPVLVHQERCRYTPRVFGVRTGQPIDVVNDDATVHNVHPLPKANAEANLTTPIKGTHAKFNFTTPETMVRFTCNVHVWMNGYAGVVAHPFFAVTGADGRFELKGLPPGTYTIEAWHERFGTQTQQVTVGERQAQAISFTFAPKG